MMWRVLFLLAASVIAGCAGSNTNPYTDPDYVAWQPTTDSTQTKPNNCSWSKTIAAQRGVPVCSSETQRTTNGEMSEPKHKEAAGTPGLACGKWRRDDSNDSFGPDCLWHTHCRYDHVRDVSYCTVNSRGDYLLQPTPSLFLGRSYASLSIGSNHHPGTTPVIRVDSNSPVYAADTIEGNFSQGQTRSLISQMRAGQTVFFSTTEWPSRVASGELSLSGFSAAHDFATRWIEQSGR